MGGRFRTWALVIAAGAGLHSVRAAHAGGLFGGGGGANRGADGAAAPVAGRTTGQPDPLPPAAEDWSPPRWSGKPTPLAREMPGRVARLAAALQEAVPARQADRPALGVRWADALRDAGNLPAAERALLVPELLRVTLSGVPRVNASEPLHRLATDPGGHAMLVRVVSEETDPAVRAAAVILLERADLDLLLRLAADDREHWWVRAQAIGHAAHQAAPDRAAADRAAAVAAAGLGHPSPEVRTQALRVLYRPGAGALPTGGEANVLARLRDPHPGVSAAAFDWVLGTGRHADPQVRQAVLAAMADGFGTDRAAALRRAGVFPTDEVTALARDLRAGSPAARRQAVDRAAQLGAAARADLTNVARLAFADVDPGVARAAERAMGAVLEKSRLASHRNPPDVAAREAHAHVDAVLAVILAPDVDPRAKRHAINELSRCTSAPTMGGLPPTPIPLGQMKQILLRSDRTMRDRVPPFVTGDRSDADTLALFAWAMSDAAPADVRRDLPQWLRPAPAFAALVRDPDPVVRLRAIDVPAHRLQTGLRADVLMPLLADPDVEVRAAAAEQIRDAAQTATSKPVVPPAQLPALLARLKAAELDKDLATREAAGAVLVRLNARPAPPAGAAPRPPAPVALLADRTQSSRTRAAVLGQIDPRGAISGAGLNTIIAHLRAPEARVRTAAVRALVRVTQEFVPPDPRAVAALADVACREPDPHVRADALRRLPELQRDADRAAGRKVLLVPAGPIGARAGGIEGLMVTVADAGGPLPVAALLADWRASVRAAALDALGPAELARAGAPATVAAMLDDAEDPVADAAARALARAGAPAATGPILTALAARAWRMVADDVPRPSDTAAALASLGALAPPAVAATVALPPEVAEHVSRGAGGAFRRALWFANSIGPAAEPLLARVVDAVVARDPEWEGNSFEAALRAARPAAAVALVPELLRLSRAPQPVVRANAVRGLAAVARHAPEAGARLTEMKGDPHIEVRWAVDRAAQSMPAATPDR